MQEAYEAARLDGAPDGEERDANDVDFSQLSEDEINYVDRDKLAPNTCRTAARGAGGRGSCYCE
jgi:hypothetical protein